MKLFNNRRCFQSIVFSSLLALNLSGLHAGEDKISPQLLRVLENTDKAVPVIVQMHQAPLIPSAVLQQTRPADVERYLKKQVKARQADVRAFVNEVVQQNQVTGEKPIRNYRFFWNVNAMMATMTSEMIWEFSERDDVTYVSLDRKIKLAPDFRKSVDSNGAEYTYGLQKLGVPQIREENPELIGSGVIVGILDTGIDAKHPELTGKLQAFKDFTDTKTEPYDDHGHGTHVAGTIAGAGAGGTQIGVAPGVKLVIGKVFTAWGGGTDSDILRGMEWMADPDGNPDTKDAPKVVNNSWGGGMSDDIKDDSFSPAVTTWVQLGIFPSFAAGNSGPSKSSMNSPGGLPQSFAVGATDSSDRIASFSSRGPVDLVIDGKKTTFVKPDVSAPGVKVFSSMPNGAYGEMSGTSMATPHTTGVVALLYQAFPNLTVDQVRDLLTKTSDDLGGRGKDNDFGAGRINANTAIKTLSEKFDLGL